MLPLTPSNSYDSYHTPTSSTGDRHILIGPGGATDLLPWALNFENFDFDNLDLDLDLHRDSFDQEEQPQRNVELNASRPTKSVTPSRPMVDTIRLPTPTSSRTQDSDNGTSNVQALKDAELSELNKSGR